MSAFTLTYGTTAQVARLRPDAIVRVPGGRALVIDAKVSLNAYQDAYGAAEEADRTRYLAIHAAAMKAHVTALSAKAYWSQFDDAPDYVINAGGVINCYSELMGFSKKRTLQLTENIYEATRNVLKLSKSENISTIEAANKIAEKRILDIRKVKSTY